MDQTEITNNEYRQFVIWVRDSIARRILAEEFPEEFLIPTYDDELEEKDASDWKLNWNSRFVTILIILLREIMLSMHPYLHKCF